MSSDPEGFNVIYQGFAELLGEKAALKIWKNYAGLTVTFPKKLYTNEYTRKFVREHKGSMTTREIAKALNLTERRIRQIIQEIAQKENRVGGGD